MAEKPRYIPFFGCMISTKYPQFEAAVRLTMNRLGVELVDVDGFTCCPDPIFYKSYDKLKWLTIAARNLCLAEEQGLDLITCCSGCTATLAETVHYLGNDPDLRKQVNKKLKKIGKQYKGTSKVRHIVTVVRDDIGIEGVAKTIVNPLQGLRVGIHYGCHLLKPSRIMQVDDPDRPQILENLVRATGAEPIEHHEKVLCCGKACMDDQIPPRMLLDILLSVEKLEVDCLGLICPTCFDEYDLGQIKLARLFNKKFNVPIIYYFQLLGLAQGFTPQQLGFQFHKVKATELLAKLELNGKAEVSAG
ncbi:MAG TPA: CoB--CoM heterodisulfide reductase iron-sulfur subunit B family protein [Acidobacteriota bacterium]|nr:CoB--CoM heterodisulfide reductase iron-sulfur subunit B family protein [Acidobacteriota bacterium]